MLWCERRRTWKRQYIFVAATMPAGEGKSVAADLRCMMPGLQWLTGDALHEAQRHVANTWVPVTRDNWQDALKVAASALPSCRHGSGSLPCINSRPYLHVTGNPDEAILEGLKRDRPRLSSAASSWHCGMISGHREFCLLAQNAVLEGGALGRGEGRTLAFAGDVAAANDVAGILTEAGLQPLVYHKGVSQADRESALAAMRTRQASIRTQDCWALLQQPRKSDWESSKDWKAPLSSNHHQHSCFISGSV